MIYSKISNEQLENAILEKRKKLNDMWNNEDSDVVDMVHLQDKVILEQNILIRRLKQDK